MYGKVNSFISSTLGSTIPFDVGKVEQKEPPKEEIIESPSDYTPIINRSGEINLPNGKNIYVGDIMTNMEIYENTLPTELIQYVKQFSPLFDKTGKMIQPSRDMFVKVRQVMVFIENLWQCI